MKVLITGASGQVGRALTECAPDTLGLSAATHQALDIGDRDAVHAAVRGLKPAVIINAAAYTAVDRAESEPPLAHRINAEGPRYLAEAASEIDGCRLLHISTDYVFDGAASAPYLPSSATGPVSVYGRSKLAGEVAVSHILPDRSIILRTAWVYAARGRNFLLSMLRLMRERGSVRVVADQFGCPTSAASVARACWLIAERTDLSGVLHWTDAGRASWYDFARAIAADALELGLLSHAVSVIPISTAEYPTCARRPANSVLDTQGAVARLGITPKPWRDELRVTLVRIKVEAAA